ncbi:unnamed protein product [Adineta ricciae]|uniref:Uncharacterized protein n=1 Tax=Adineta ricciae TaxID=249248 RepID=A0A815BE33_ADIRI|nr:unnamed protein product [Adineta ricciae]CAF1270143.1 unnamed protein product [Adineta ricciae]
MQLFILFFFLTIQFPGNNPLQCMHYYGILTIPSVNTLDLPKVKEQINQSVTIKNKTSCYAHVALFSDSQTLVLIFDEVDLFTFTVNVDVAVMTIINLLRNENETLFNNMIGFLCDKEDQCNRLFIFDYLEWLFSTRFEGAAAAVRPLLLPQNSQTGVCYIDENGNSRQCSSRVCSFAIQYNQAERGCFETYTRTMVLGIGMKMTLRKTEQQDLTFTQSFDHLAYICSGNLCNSKTNDEQIKQIVKDYYNVSSLEIMLKEKFNREYLPDVSSTTSTTVKTTSILSTDQMTTSSQGQISSSSKFPLIYVAFLLLIEKFF